MLPDFLPDLTSFNFLRRIFPFSLGLLPLALDSGSVSQKFRPLTSPYPIHRPL